MMTWQDPFSDFPICLDSDDDDDRRIYEPTRVCIVVICIRTPPTLVVVSIL
jgi:hypothetical protein